MITLGKNNNQKNIFAELEGGLIEKIDHLVDGTGQFKSRDDFIELACHEFMVRRNPAAALLG
jgi:Arc/MetJ-type ribon-helix-helix transcriptional regulator